MSNKKYELIPTDKRGANGEALFQIRALRSFANVRKSEFGGYITKENNLSHDGNAWVYGNAEVYGNARVSGNAEVYGDARVFGIEDKSTETDGTPEEIELNGKKYRLVG